MGVPFSTMFAWVGTPIFILVLAVVVWWVEEQRNLDLYDGPPIEFEEDKKGDSKK